MSLSDEPAPNHPPSDHGSPEDHSSAQDHSPSDASPPARDRRQLLWGLGLEVGFYLLFGLSLAAYRLTVDASSDPSLSAWGLALKTAGGVVMAGVLFLGPALLFFAVPALFYNSLRTVARKTHLWGALVLGTALTGAFLYGFATSPPIPANAQFGVGLGFATLIAGALFVLLVGVVATLHVVGNWLDQ